ncbi:contact-dependent growth inhibition system immunity protein [Mycobacterium sp. SMC-4]|uniref:contact-dependent growth inhibition system immunity protein n=1 Tax=Mycobacterium sp. SMC-4 TaxID=2857059 RepID=UPI003CFD2019
MNDGSISEDLYQFLAAYFHEDWDIEAADWAGLVDGYVDDFPVVESLRGLADEIDDVREARTEPDLEEFLVRTVGVAYGPEPLTYKEWLGQIARRLRLHADGIEKSRAR